jgi:hypothetical protein
MVRHPDHQRIGFSIAQFFLATDQLTQTSALVKQPCHHWCFFDEPEI